MKNKKSIYGFLTEFVIMLFVFALVSTVAVNLFSKGKMLSVETIRTNEGLIVIENIAEKMKTYNGEDLNYYLNDFSLVNDNYNVEVNVSVTKGNYILYNSNIIYTDSISRNVILEINVLSIGSEDYD